MTKSLRIALLAALTLASPAAARAQPVSQRFVRSLDYPARTACVATVRFSTDGSQLFAAGFHSDILQFWDLATGKELRRIEVPTNDRNTAEHAELPADWSAVYVPWEKTARVPYDKNGLQAVWVEYEGAVLAFDVATGQPRPSFKPPAGRSVIGAYVSPDGRKIVATEELAFEAIRNVEQVRKTNAVLWDTHTATAKPLGEGLVKATFTLDSQRLVVVYETLGPPDGMLKLFDVEGTKLAEVTAGPGEMFGRPVISPDGKLLAASQGAGRIDQPCVIRVCDLSSLKDVAAFKSDGEFPFMGFAFSPDSQWLAATDYRSGIHIWDIATRRTVLTKSFSDPTWLRSVAFTPDGRRLAVMGQPKWDADKDPNPDPRDLPQPRVFLFDLTAPAAEPKVVICPHGYMGGLAISPDGKTLAVGGVGAVHLFDLTLKR